MKNFIKLKYTILYFIFLTTIISACPHDTDNIITIQNQSNLEKLLKNNVGPSLIYFYMNNCSWCSKIISIIEELSENDQFCKNITFYKVNGPQTNALELVNQYLNKKIPGYPTIFFINQGRVFDTQIGGTTQDIMLKKLTALLKESQKRNK